MTYANRDGYLQTQLFLGSIYVQLNRGMLSFSRLCGCVVTTVCGGSSTANLFPWHALLFPWNIQ